MTIARYLALACLSLVPAVAFSAEQQHADWACGRGREVAASKTHRLTRTEAVQIAVAEAKRQNVDLDKFAQSWVCFDASKKEPSWTVSLRAGANLDRPGITLALS